MFVRFLDLPRELRDQVYAHAIKALPPLVPKHFASRVSKLKSLDKIRKINEMQTGSNDPCSLLFVNKQIFKECLEVFQSYARIVLRLTQQEVCHSINIATTAQASATDDSVKIKLTNTLLNLILNYKNFVLKLDYKDVRNTIPYAGALSGEKWTQALRAFLVWTYGTRPLTPRNAKNVTVCITAASMRNPSSLGIHQLSDALTEAADVASKNIVVEAHVSTADILDSDYRKRALQSFQYLNECRRLGLEVTVNQH